MNTTNSRDTSRAMTRLATATSLVLTGLLLAACGGGSSTPAVPTATVENSSATAMAYVQSVTATADVQADGSEPSAVPDTLAVDDGGEPRAVN